MGGSGNVGGAGGAGTVGQGTNGTSGGGYTSGGSGSGGGASGTGSAGLTSSITGTATVYATGGTGGSYGGGAVTASAPSGYGSGGNGANSVYNGAASSGNPGVVILAFQNDFIPAITYGATSLVYTINKTARPGYSVYTFTSGTGAISVKPVEVTVEYLIVGGGGVSVVGGGGAGGMIENIVDVVSGQSFQLKVGAGGTYPNFSTSPVDWYVGQGKESYFSPQPYNHVVPYVVLGGGFGSGQYAPGNGGGSGGSGGGGWGAGGSYNFGGYGTSSGGYTQGYAGAAPGSGNPYPDRTAYGGGGGGAGGPGIGRTGATPCAGGPPRASSITGSTRYYAAGGDGTTNSGFGVDKLGSIYGNGGGTSGVVILAYPFSHAQLTITGTLTHTVDTTSRPGYRVYTFTAGTGQVTF